MEKLALGDADYARLAQILRKVDFFSPLTIDQLDKIMPHILLAGFKSGETVFKQGDSGDAFYIVAEGRVGIRIKTGFFFSQQVSELGPGGFFGEAALLSAAPRSATARCNAASKLFVLLRADFQRLLQTNPAFAGEVKKIIEQRQFVARHFK